MLYGVFHMVFSYANLDISQELNIHDALQSPALLREGIISSYVKFHT